MAASKSKSLASRENVLLILVTSLLPACSAGAFSLFPFPLALTDTRHTVGQSSLQYEAIRVGAFGWHYQHSSSTCLFAKKKKKGNKSKNKKSGFEWASSFTLKPFEAQATRELVSSAVSSFEGRTGKPLAEELKGVADLPKALWNAPIACVVVSQQDETNGNTPVVKYANVAALETVGLQPNEFERLMASDSDKKPKDAIEINLPCSLNGDKKYESGYSKKMFKLGNDDVTITNAQRWLIEKSALVDGKFVTEAIGLAYAWNEWMLGDSIVCSPGGKRREAIDEEDLEEAIANQAAAIRELKEVQGLGNKDPQVAEAVQKLLRLKSLLEDSQLK